MRPGTIESKMKGFILHVQCKELRTIIKEAWNANLKKEAWRKSSSLTLAKYFLFDLI